MAKYAQVSLCLSVLLAVAWSADIARAEVIFGDSMNYTSSANMRLVWKRAGASGGQATRSTTFAATTITTTKTPATSPMLSLNNGLVYVDLNAPLKGNFTLQFKMLDTSYSRFSHLVLMDATGRFGYGVFWDTKSVSTSGGRGSVSLTKLSLASAWSSTTYTTFGTKLITVDSNHPATGYAVTDPNTPAYSTTFQDFSTFELTWTEATGAFTLKQDNQVILTFTDTEFKSFSRLYFSGNSTSMLDEVLLTSTTAWPAESDKAYGADVPFVTLEAEDPANTVLGGSVVKATKSQLGTSPPTPAQEASGRGYVQLNNTGHYVQFSNVPKANTLVIRHCIPDAPGGGGLSGTLGLYVNGQRRQSINLSSKYNWLYAQTSSSTDNGQNNVPTSFPHVFWDETRLFITGGVQAGDTIRLQKDAQDTAVYYRIDLIDLEEVAGPLSQPANSLSVTTYGANGTDAVDDSTAFSNCINAARTQGKVVWIPAGKYMLGTSLTALNGVKVQGAGMWYTELYHTATGSGTFRFFRMSGTNSSVSDLFIESLTETNRSTNICWPFSDIGSNWSIKNVWMTHTGVGMWMAGSDGVISNCRVRFTYADGININNGNNYNTNRVLVENNHIRSAGDDSIAILSLENDVPGETHNITARNNTTICPWWGSSLALGGGSGHVIENNALYDGAGFVLNLPAAYPKYPITSALFRRNLIVRCGRNLAGQKRGAIWSNPGYTTISGMVIEGNIILDPIYRGIHFSTSLSQQIVFRGNLIDSPGEDAIYVNSGALGSAVLDTNSVRNLNAGFSEVSNNSSSFAITQLNAAPYHQWRFDRFSVAELTNMAVSGNAADPDGDGRQNLGEYGLGTLPKTVDSTTAEPTPRVEGDYLVITYFRPTGRTDLVYDVEWSSDLLTWQSGGSHVQESGSTAVTGGALVTVRTAATINDLPRQFLRLRIKKS